MIRDEQNGKERNNGNMINKMDVKKAIAKQILTGFDRCSIAKYNNTRGKKYTGFTNYSFDFLPHTKAFQNSSDRPEERVSYKTE